MNLCTCGCGEQCNLRFVRGHNYRGVKRGRFSPERLVAYRQARNDRSTVPKAVVTPTIREIAWAAGFIEGEGGFKALGSAHSTVVNADQVQREPLERLQHYFGGTIYEKKWASMGHARSPAFRWQICGARARGFMLTIYPFMSPKRKTQLVRSL